MTNSLLIQMFDIMGVVNEIRILLKDSVSSLQTLTQEGYIA